MTMIDIIRKLIKTPSSATPEILSCMDGMAERNVARMDAIKKEMGELYILHPSHKKSRLEVARPV